MFGEMESGQGKNRNFICSCQKAYLSYAALFTHIKQKHGGKAPGEIVRPRSLNKRGRPRKSQKSPLQRGIKGESYNGLSISSNMENNNNKRFIIGSNSADLSNSNNYNIMDGDNARGGFKSFSRVGTVPIAINKKASTLSYHSQHHHHHQQQQPQQIIPHPHPHSHPSTPPHSHYYQQQVAISYSEQEQNMEFSNLNNQFSNNTLTMAAIIIGLQQTFKEAVGLELVRDDKLECFASYAQLKRYHGMKLSMKLEDRKDEDVFVLGNVICAFLNFCHQTLDSKASYQQIVLLMVCLLDHIKTLKQSHSINILTQCRKQVIHQSLPSFFEQYLQKVLVRLRMKYWVFRQNNSFKVLIWFLNWLSAIEVNYLKGICGGVGQEKREERMVECVDDVVGVQEQVQKNNVSQQHNNLTTKNTAVTHPLLTHHVEEDQQQQQCSQEESQDQVQFENPVFFVTHQQENNEQVINNPQPSSPSQPPSSSSSSCSQQQLPGLQKAPSSQQSQQNNNNPIQLQRLSSQVR